MATSEMIFPRSEKPSKILQWKVREGTTVATGRVLFLYKNLSPDASDIVGSEKKFRATQFGKIIKLLFNNDDHIQPGDPVVTVEGCRHPTVMKDLCAECGVDLREECTGNEKELPTRASVPMVHSVPELKVTPELAEKIGKEDVERLLKDKKLALLVDLDQTIVHTTNDNVPVNMKDVYHYQLYGPHSLWYHTRLRPNTRHFLLEMSKYYELHICTFGARNYAHKVTSLLDADGVFFSHRILSRDECFDPLSKTANLKALFPCGDDMVCIIDDREDVWQGCGNLVQVKPYHFFRHTGDIHAATGFEKNEDSAKTIGLPEIDEPTEQEEAETNIENGETPTEVEEKPKTDERENEPKTENPTDESKSNESQSGYKKLEKETEEKIEDSQKPTEEKNEVIKIEKADEKVEETVEETVEEKIEEKNEEKNEEKIEDKVEDKVEDKETKEIIKAEEKPMFHENVIDEDHDDYLLYLEDILKRIHEEFYRDLDKETGKRSLREVIPRVREKVLKGLHITFSGIVPTHQKLEQSRAYRVAKAFGAEVYQDLVEKTTHLVAIRLGTAKVNTAKKNGKIKIVNPEWLWTCAERWEHVDERLYPLTNKVRGSRIPPPHCSNPERFEGTEKSESFANSINPLLSFSREEIDKMGKEVDEDLEDLEMDENFDVEENDNKSDSEGLEGSGREEENENEEETLKRQLSDIEDEWQPEVTKKRKKDSSSSSSSEDSEEDIVTKFRRGEDLPDDLDLGDPSSQASFEDLENDDLEDDREWNAMGAALEREFLSE